MKKSQFAVLIRTFPSTAPCPQGRLIERYWLLDVNVRSLKKRCISNALDGSEDYILLEDDGEDKEDSDWVTDNDSVISDDGESDK